jgi:predicted MFS family arabinose efflux permease
MASLAPSPVRPAQRPWVVLLLIWTIFIVHGVDRSVVLVLLEPMRKEFDLNDSQVGLIVGLGYAIPFAIAGIPFGALADRVRRTRLLAGLLALWSVLTALAGLVPSYALLLLTRAGVGASEAGAPPIMLSILSDTFDARRRPAALSFYYTAPFIGLMLGSTIAGQISGAYGWRTALLAIGMPGVVLALAILLVLREPRRARFDTVDGEAAAGAVPIPVALRFAIGEARLRNLIIALVLAAFVTLAVSNWTPTLLQRVYGIAPGKAGLLTAVAIGLTGGLGSLTGGFLAARFGRGERDRLRRLSGLAILLATPLAVIAPLLPSATGTLILLGIWSFVGSAYLGPAWGIALATTPAHMRATIMALAVVLTNLVGAGLGPQAVGAISDLLALIGDTAHLSHAIALTALTGFVTALLFLRREAPLVSTDR